MSTDPDLHAKLVPHNRAIFALPAVLALSACVPMIGSAPAFAGRWMCGAGGPELRLTETSVRRDGDRIAIDEVREYGPNYTLDLVDVTRITLFDVTDETMTYHLPAYGLTRSCERI